MNNLYITGAPRTTFAPAVALALYTTFATIPAEAVQPPPALSNWTETAFIEPSAHGVFSINLAVERSFEERLTDFYSSLLSSQQDLGSEIESLLAANISDLYED
ncbi:hypothetical protein PshuTeo2_36490 [Pseudomonas hunanensis]|uniref:hypothetical protein n=1 Tax=Pseudomonas hunanensis TaxID=1247546 RepID=UPI002AA0D414|nr:hypothetical protein [Pseudomonas hunanensis]MDY7073517.1 hypothetical protein [Pseudomonas hunanensis]